MFGNSVRSLMLVLLTTSHPAWPPGREGSSLPSSWNGDSRLP